MLLNGNKDESVNELVHIREHTATSGHLFAGIRFDQHVEWKAVTIHSMRSNLDNSGFFTNTPTIPINGLDISFPATARLLGIASTSALDTQLGTGAQQIIIEGLNALWDPIVDVVFLNGQTKVLSNIPFLRVNQTSVTSVGSAEYNQGTIYISDLNEVFVSGAPTINVHEVIGVGWNLSSGGQYSTPRNTEAVLVLYKAAADASDAKPYETETWFRQNGLGLPFYNVARLLLNGGSSEFTIPTLPKVSEKTDVRLTSRSSTNTDITHVTIWASLIIKRIKRH